MSNSFRKQMRLYYHAAIRKPILTALPPLLRHLPISSKVFGPPKRLIPKTKEWVEQYNSSGTKPASLYTKVYDGQHITRLPPKTLGAEINPAFEQSSVQTDDMFVAAIPNGRVWHSDGAIITPDDILIEDVSAEYDVQRYIRGRHSAFSQVRLPRIHAEEGVVAVLTTLSADYYSHWLLDVLPRFELLRLAGYTADTIDKYYLPEPTSSYQKEALARLGIPQSKILDSKKFPHVEAKMLIVSSLPQGVFQPTKWLFDFLRTNLSTKLSDDNHNQPSGNPRRIYVSREQAAYRRILNENEVINFLRGLGFHVVIAESLSLAEKSAVYAAADVVVSPAGSGFANMMFCKPRTKLIEIFNPIFLQGPSWLLCNELDLDYYYLLGEECCQKAAPIKADIRVSMDHLSDILNLAGIY